MGVFWRRQIQRQIRYLGAFERQGLEGCRAISSSRSDTWARVAAPLLSCAPIVGHKIPTLDARFRRLVYGVAAKSRFPQCAYQRSENTAKLQETCTRPICMHAKTLVTSVTCGIRGRRFYLALLPVVFRSPPKPALGARLKPQTCSLGRRFPMHESGAGRDRQDAHVGASI